MVTLRLLLDSPANLLGTNMPLLFLIQVTQPLNAVSGSSVFRDVLAMLIAAVFFPIGAALLRAVGPLRAWMLMSPVPIRRNKPPMNRSELMRLFDAIDPDDRGAKFWELARRKPQTNENDWRKFLDSLTPALSRIARPGAYGITTRIVHGGDIAAVQRKAHAALFAAADLRRLTQIDPSNAQREFSRKVTELICAPILADGLDARGRVASAARVIDRGSSGGNKTETYAEGHCETAAENIRAKCQWNSGGDSTNASQSRAGDYDGQVMVVRGCSVNVDPLNGDLVMLFESEESCYIASEQGPRHCKKLTRDSPKLTVQLGESISFTGEIDPILTAYVMLITGDRRLILCKRSARTRNGPGTISATAGGVCEPGGPDRTAIDRDVHGWPDPARTAARELQEELGVELDPSDLSPMCCFLTNSFNTNHDKTDANGNIIEFGQLVVCALYLGRTDLTFKQVKRALRISSDPAKGGFEVDRLVAVKVDKLANLTDDLRRVAASGELDQHAWIGSIYIAQVLWKPEDVITAFTALLDDFAPPEPFQSFDGLW